MMWRYVGLGLGLTIGAGVSLQARINGALGAQLHDGIAAAAISFGSGLIALLIAFAISGRLRAGLRRVRQSVRARELRPWQLLGGLCGAAFVASQGLTVAALGVTAFTVAVVAGQLLSSLVVDRLGIGPGGRTAVTVRRAGGAGLAVVAVLLANAGGSEPGSAATAMPIIREVPAPLLIVLPALAGVGLAWQQAVNGRVGQVGGSMSATLINFGVGVAALLVIELILGIRAGWPQYFPTEPWLYLGGVIGVTFIAVGVLVVRWIGVLLLGLTSVAGQLLTSLLLDWVTPTGAPLSPMALIGSAVTLLAVIVAAGTEPAPARRESEPVPQGPDRFSR